MAAVGDGVSTAVSTLTGAFNANTGQDASGVMFGRQYENTARDVLKAVAAGINACRKTGYGIQVGAVNYSRAEALSDISGRAQPLPSPPCPAPVSAAAAPSAQGPGVMEPTMWKVVEFLVGDLWPNGSPAAMRTAAAAWRTFGASLYGVIGDMAGPYNTIGSQQLPEAELIKAPMRDIGTAFSSLGGSCQQLASELEGFAADVEKTQNAIRELLSKLGSIGGIVGTFFEFFKGHGEDELHKIADDIKTVMNHLKNEAAAKRAGVAQAEQNVDTWVRDLEKAANREFTEFFGEHVGQVLSTAFNSSLDSTEGGFRWLVSNAEGIEDLNPLRFAYDPQGALATWKGVADLANAVTNPASLAAMAKSNPERFEALVKGLARADEWSKDRPMLGASQNLLDILTLPIAAGKAGEAGEISSAAARVAKSGDVTADVGGITGKLSEAGEAGRAAAALENISTGTPGLTKSLEDIAGKPPALDPPAGGRPLPAPHGPETPPPAPVAKPAADSPAPSRSLPAEAPTNTGPTAVPQHDAPTPVEHAPRTVATASTAAEPATAHAAPVDARHIGSAGDSPPPDAPVHPATAPFEPTSQNHSIEHSPVDGGNHHSVDEGANHDGHHPNGESDAHQPHDGDNHGVGDGQLPDHLPNGDAHADAQNPAASTEPAHQSAMGEPVDLATGEYLLPAVDVHLPGILPLRLTRQHRSQYRHGLWFGPTWACTFDSRVVVTQAGVTTIDADGTMLTFDHPDGVHAALPHHGRNWLLYADPGGGYRLEEPGGGLIHWFLPKPVLQGRDLADGVLSISEITDRNSNRISFAYDEFGAPTGVHHSAGYGVEVHRANGRIVGYTSCDRQLRAFGYQDGNLTSVTVATGATTEFSYDDARRVVSWTDSSGARYVNSFDAQGRVVSQTGADGVWAGTFAYQEDGDGRVTLYADAVGNRHTYRFDQHLRTVAVTAPGGRTTRTAYGDGRDPRSVTDAVGATTAYRHSVDGDLLQVTDPLGRSASISLTDGRRIQTVGFDSAITRYEYDDAGRVVAIRDGANGLHRWEYGDTGAVKARIDPDGRRIDIACNAAGLPTCLTDEVGGQTRLAYDDFGRLVSVQTPDGGVTTMSYDAEGRLAQRTAGDGGRESWFYDGEGNCVGHQDAAGSITQWEYGFYDLVTARIDPEGARTAYGYDKARRLTSVTNPAGLVWRYEYGPDGLISSQTDFNGATTAYTYDDCGRVRTRINAAGQSVTYAYDLAGNVIAEESDSGERVEFCYDAANRCVSASCPAGQLSLERDVLGRITSESWNGRSVETVISAAGQTVSMLTPSGVPVSLQYDRRGVVKSLGVAGRNCEVATDEVGRLSSCRVGTTTVESTFDVVGRLVNRTVTAESTRVLGSAEYRYRDDGSLTAVAAPSATSMLGTAARYEVDDLGRLLSRTLPDGTREAFQFDGAGNLSSAEGAWEYRGALLTDDGRSKYSYDRAGRLTTVRTKRLGRKADVWQYTWDAWDRLRSVTTPDGRRFEYSYDPLGRRVAKHGSDGSHSEFSWLGMRMVEEAAVAPGAGTTVTSWAYLPGELTPQIQLSQSDVDREFFAIVTDQVGAPVALVDPLAGSVVGQSHSTVWGSTTWTGVATPWRFPGQYADAESGLHYNVHRYYSPAVGRYISPDPLGLAPAPNPYTYPPNPTGWIDPLGLNPCKGGPPDSVIRHWGPHDEGPLERTAATFTGGSYTELVTQQPTILYRAHTAGEDPIGRFWSRDIPWGPVQAQMDSALNPLWGNRATTFSRIEVPAGTRIFEGTVAPQDIPLGGVLLGGGNQIVFGEFTFPPREWLR